MTSVLRRIAVVLVVVTAAAGSLWADNDPVEARAFEVRYRPLADAADLISPVISEQGRVTLRPRLDTLVVEDHRSVLERVESLLASYDLPPRNVEITVSLFLGTSKAPGDDEPARKSPELSEEVRGVLESLTNVTKWVNYEPLGSRSVTGAEGDTVVVNLSDEFRVVFTVDSVHESRGAIKFESFALQRMKQEESHEEIEDLYRTGMVLTAGRLTVVGAAKDPESQRALFLFLQARPR
jgi:hypothetical protein